jgi:hypothetical protein
VGADLGAVDQLERAPEQGPQPLAPRRPQGGEGAVVHLALLLEAAAVDERDRQLLDVPAPGPQYGQGVGRPAGQGQAGRPDQRPHHGQQQRQGQLAQAARLEHGRQGVALDQVAGVADGPGLAAAGGGGGEVADPGLGHDQDPAPGQMRPPAQVEVVAEGRHALVEAADVQQSPAPDQHPGGVDEEHVADLVVLALVDLVVLDLGHGPARPVDREADLRQPVGVGPGDQLGAEDGRARA